MLYTSMIITLLKCKPVHLTPLLNGCHCPWDNIKFLYVADEALWDVPPLLLSRLPWCPVSPSMLQPRWSLSGWSSGFLSLPGLGTRFTPLVWNILPLHSLYVDNSYSLYRYPLKGSILQEAFPEFLSTELKLGAPASYFHETPLFSSHDIVWASWEQSHVYFVEHQR